MTRLGRILGSVTGLVLAAVMAAPVALAQASSSLPAGGGEPGKVYLEAQKAMKAQDVPALKKVMAAERVKQMDSPDFKQMLGMLAEMMPTDVKITGGTVTGDSATLTLTGKMGGEATKGEARMVKEGGAWKLEKEDWKN